MKGMVRFSPNVEMRRLQNEFDRLFSDFFPTSTRGTDDEAITWAPRVDLGETDEAYVIRVDLPGLTKEDLTIDYHEGTLSISGERKAEHTEEGTNFVRLERRTGHFYRAFTLPKAVDTNKIEATYTDGVLRIHVPKAEDSKPRRITVN